jgi:UTP-glucose-1-phosphate uridylyltransferase
VRSKKATLLVLAAGLGSRYGGLKQIEPVGPTGETVLDYSVFDALRAGFTRVVFVIRRDIEQVFREKVGRRFASHIEVGYAFQELNHLPGKQPAPETRERPWGTGHAVWCSAAEISDPFAVINGDDFYGAESFQQLRHFLSAADTLARPVQGCMVGFKLVNTLSEFGAVSRGICHVDAGHVLKRVEECAAIERSPKGARQKNPDGSMRTFDDNEVVSMNCWGFTPAIFPLLGRQLEQFLETRRTEPKAEFYLPAAVAELIASQDATVTVLPSASTWFGITYRQDRPKVVAALQALIAAGGYPKQLWGHRHE